MSRRWQPAAALVVAVTLALVACSGQGQVRRPVDVVEAFLTAPDTIQLVVDSCNGGPEVTELDQGETQVRVEVTSTATDPGDGCLDLFDLALDAPLGDRTLVDRTSGATVPVTVVNDAG